MIDFEDFNCRGKETSEQSGVSKFRASAHNILAVAPHQLGLFVLRMIEVAQNVP